ncbi:MAG: hypothetical protein KTR25_05370 [Myxococcales bacterium]|nr:hypothetical protein [Myxococcales bacterium]
MTGSSRGVDLDLCQVFRFEIARLKLSAQRLQAVDHALRELRQRLETRAIALSQEADGDPPIHDSPDTSVTPSVDGVPMASLRAAQAQATAELARQAALGEVLKHAGVFHLVAAMAVSRWIEAIAISVSSPVANRAHREALLKSHIDAGRVVHRMLVALRSQAGLRSGCGQAVCALVVAELAPPDLADFAQEQIEEGWERACRAHGVRSEQDARRAISQALREGAHLVEGLATKAEVAAQKLLQEEVLVEVRVHQRLLPR